MNRKILTGLIILVLLMGSFNFFFYVKPTGIKVIEYEFLIAYLGLFIGFALTIYTFIVSSVGRVIEKLEQKKLFEDARKQVFFNILGRATKNFKDDTNLIIYSFYLLCILLISDNILKEIDYFKSTYAVYSKYHTSESIRFFILLLTVLATADLVKGMFNVTELMHIADTTKNKHSVNTNQLNKEIDEILKNPEEK